jgi:hypothetical protein
MKKRPIPWELIALLITALAIWAVLEFWLLRS